MISKDVRRGLLSTLAGVAVIGLTWSTGAPSTTADAPHKASTQAPADKPYPAPDFTLPDVDGVKHSLSDYRGRAVAMFFFCGCQWCHHVGGQWSVMQKAGALPTRSDGKGPLTLIVFQGDATAAKQFAHETSLDMSNTVMLTDVDMDVTLNKYNADPCPRVFVVDPAGNVTYTNNHKDDDARTAPPTTIATRALNAVLKAAG